MSNCNNCFNGCTEIVSDKCVRYTGINIPTLGIETGDTLFSVEQSITTYLVSVLNGSGVKIDISTIDVCTVVQKYLPVCSGCVDVSIADISKALIQAACDLQEQIDDLVTEFQILNGDYNVSCLDGVMPSSNTHDVVQAVIIKLCEIEVNLAALALDLETNYVTYTELPALIQAYLNSQNLSTKYYNRMIPFTVVEYYGNTPGNFDGTGAGIVTGPWEKIYLCNGLNGTPDKRGVVGVGTTDGSMFGNTLPPETIPGTFNPTYIKGQVPASARNSTTLLLSQIPSHNHVATASVNDPGHFHSLKVNPNAAGSGFPAFEASSTEGSFDTESKQTGISVTVTTANQGDGQPHSNVQVGLGCLYIMYIP
jgi:microcystin-dependent protein